MGHRMRIRTTNDIKCAGQELTRRSRVVRIFPKPTTVFRLGSALVKDWREKRAWGRRFLNMEPSVASEYAERKAA